MLMEREHSGFLLVDVQEKLTPLVLNHEALVKRCEWLLQLVKALNVPMIVSEQYPKGLGSTLKSLRQLADTAPTVEKVHFSCYRDAAVAQLNSLGRRQMVLAGIETHVCVLQTALDLKKAQVEVFVVVDAVSSRHEVDHRYGLKRMKQAGIHLVTAEMVFFEWLGKAGTPEFKSLSQAFFKE